MNFMYKYVDFHREIYLGHFILFLYIFILTKKCYEFSLLNDTFNILFFEELIVFNTPL